MQRLIAPSEFTGKVEVDAQYILVDDVSTMGDGTLADLANYVLMNGRRVVGSVVLVNAARSGKVIPAPKTVELLERRFGGADFIATFGIEPTALTREEAQYLVGFRTADELRNRAAAAKQARVERLRSKGIRSEEVI